jgi:hypothetical protein
MTLVPNPRDYEVYFAASISRQKATVGDQEDTSALATAIDRSAVSVETTRLLIRLPTKRLTQAGMNFFFTSLFCSMGLVRNVIFSPRLRERICTTKATLLKLMHSAANRDCAVGDRSGQ